MKDIIIKFVSKESIYPAFGYYHHDTGIIEIQEGLSKFEIASLLVHEFGHFDDREDNESQVVSELESITVSMFYPIIGTVIILLKSLNPTRIKWKIKFLNKK